MIFSGRDFFFEIPELHTDINHGTGVTVDGFQNNVLISGFTDDDLGYVPNGNVALKGGQDSIQITFQSRGYNGDCSNSNYPVCPPVKSLKLVYWTTPWRRLQYMPNKKYAFI